MKNMFKAFMAFQKFKKGKEESEQEERRVQLQNERQMTQQRLAVSLASKIRNMQRLYDRIAEESGYREQVIDNTYMVNDLWSYSLSEFIICGKIYEQNQGELLEELMRTLSVKNLVSGKEHFSNLENNKEYRDYILNCFEGKSGVPGFFWILLASMSGNEGERTRDTIQFTKDYCDFIRELNSYLSYRFPNTDFSAAVRKLINVMLERSNEFLGKDDPFEDFQMPQIVNPLLISD